MTGYDPPTVTSWAIRHRTVYRYSTPVAFAPHVLRLTPRAEGLRRLTRTLNVTPEPVEVTDFSDAYGNTCTRVTFGGEAVDELVIDSRLDVEPLTEPLRPAVGLPLLPWWTPPDDSLALYRQPDESAEVAALAQRLAAEVGREPLAFFDHLCSTLYSTLDRKIRVEGAAQTPAETLRSGRGACRDLTVLFLAVGRSLGLAGRFVSGYQGQEQSLDGRRHLHAWPEVYLAELGWLGWDPTHGIRVGAGHVALSAAPEQAATMPVEGGFYFNGPTVTSTLSYEISFDANS